MKKIFTKISPILLVLFIGSTTFAQKRLLYVGDFNHISAMDTVMKEKLRERDFEITSVAAADFTENYVTADAYDGFDVVLLSESMGSTDTKAFKDAGFPIPCILTEGWAVKMERWDMIPLDVEAADFLQAGDALVDEGILTLIIEDVDHWIAERYDPDYELVWSTSTATGGVTGFQLDGHVDGAVEIGYYNLSEFTGLPSIWAIPAGSVILTDNTVIESNLVIIGSIADGMTEPTAEYIDFLDLCIFWATDQHVGIESSMQSNQLSVYPNPTNGIINISLALTVSGNVRVNIYDIAGKLMKSLDSLYLSAGDNAITLDISGLADAQYIYEIVTSNDVMRGKIVKK